MYDSTYLINLEDGEGNLYSSDPDGTLDSIIENITNNDCTNFVFLLGIKSFVNDLSDEYKAKFDEFVATLNEKNAYLFIVDNYSSLKKITLDKWYIDNADNSCGIWIGTGLNVQVVFNINNLIADDANASFEGLVYAINDGEYRVIKGIGE